MDARELVALLEADTLLAQAPVGDRNRGNSARELER
jgi:hypothetical protein